jgi:hypothetical protein
MPSRLLSLGVNLLSREGYSQKEERKGKESEVLLLAVTSQRLFSGVTTTNIRFLLVGGGW